MGTLRRLQDDVWPTVFAWGEGGVNDLVGRPMTTWRA